MYDIFIFYNLRTSIIHLRLNVSGTRGDCIEQGQGKLVEAALHIESSVVPKHVKRYGILLVKDSLLRSSVNNCWHSVSQCWIIQPCNLREAKVRSVHLWFLDLLVSRRLTIFH